MAWTSLNMRDRDSCGRVVKRGILVVNVALLLGGLVILGLGIWAIRTKSNMDTTDFFYTFGVVLVTVGVASAAVSVLGALGALREIKCLLLAFFIALLLIFIILSIGALIGLAARDGVEDVLGDNMQQALVLYGKDDGETEVWDYVQRNLECCGIRNVSDWLGNPMFGMVEMVPKSCCKDNMADPCAKRPSKDNAHHLGCLPKLSATIEVLLGFLAGIAIAMAVVLIIGMVFTYTLFKML